MFSPTALAVIVAAIAMAPAVGPLHPVQDPDAPTADAKVVADFQARVKEYAALHQKLESTLPPLPKETPPEVITKHQQDLQRLLTRARARGRKGDIFTDSIRGYFRRQIARVVAGADGRAVRSSLLDEDTRGVRLAVNGRYPSTVPVSTVPPQILLILPRLPEELEYRFVGDRLVLLDVHAHTIVDFMDKAIPR